MSPEGRAPSVNQGVIQPKGFPGLPPGWISEWETFPSSCGKLQLFSVFHHPSDWKSHRALIVLHGAGEHGGRYLHVPHYMKGLVDLVYCLDLRGHGRSEGIRGHVDRFDEYVEDAAVAVRRVDEMLRRRFGKSEIHLMAHSMGGLIGLRLLRLRGDLPIRSATISAPLLGLKMKVPVVKKAAAHALSKIWGSLQLSNELDPSLVSHDPAVVEAYKNDRLMHDKSTPRFYTELMAAMADTLANSRGITVPVQLLVPMGDKIVDPEPGQALFRALRESAEPAARATAHRLVTYPGLYHEPFNELEKDRVFADLVSWIESHRAQG